ncbi:uncharacterized protein B0I36DRAFT_362264 [Microdochium trichocladiopsis]|uniref:Long chronological lifespan protein 2 n=1 Tax=Microdochium trichocladiopsis TaxID=1682393 RepID=A0A9P8Y9G1_9PEZI|nr:uncharacterized protein B0I36DRAFT_362264 [Microdochium trichocladiopsis]KAH7033619.1 hypothetical protein B0I36DRAFT_362264 [Microdochium trichocladiopsis]
MRSIPLLLTTLLAFLPALASAQFGGFFEQMFGGQQQQQHHHQQQHGGGGQNGPSDSSFYRSNVDRITCDKYLCPDTLACVHFPHHCPCPYPANEEKVELADGQRICVSRGGFKEGEAARKVELARKGLL